ncbi:MAG: hypothetical protein KA259_00810 [Caldilineaceae bacterium]|nr:hypothetical protein [Caldilineaceae bacterium]MBP8292344.1 hypothetical protein [Caldilineaceae bacterium]
MFPVALIAIGVAVLVFGRRLAILGAAVGALLGVVLLGLFTASGDLWLQLAFVGGLAVAGFFVAGFARGIVDVVLLVMGALGGAAITLALLDLLGMTDPGAVRWLLAVVGGAVGLIMMRRFRRGSRDWGIIILASLIGALLVTRGLTALLPFLQDTIWRSLLFIVLAGGGFVYQGGFLAQRKAAKKAAPAKAAPPTETAPAAKPAPAAPAPSDAATTAAAPTDQSSSPPPASN